MQLIYKEIILSIIAYFMQDDDITKRGNFGGYQPILDNR